MDRNKPLIDSKIVDRQIQMQNKLFSSIVQFSYLPLLTFDEDSSKATKKNSVKSRVPKGNVGYCMLDMSLLNLCGVPSLWLDSRIYATSGTPYFYKEKDEEVRAIEPYIKPNQKKLLRLQYKVFELLRFHKIFENEKYYGKANSGHYHLQVNSLFQDFYSFSTENLKDNSKFNTNELQKTQNMQLMQSMDFDDDGQSKYQNGPRSCTLNIVQGSDDFNPID